MSYLLRLTLPLYMVLVFTQVLKAGSTPPNTKPFTRFKILLTAPIVNDTMPFDVPFIIWGEVDPSTEPVGGVPTTAVTLRIARPRDVTNCSSVPEGDYTENLGRSEARIWAETDYRDRGMDPPADLRTSQRRQFEFLVPKRDPGKLYCFLFLKEPGRLLTTDEIALVVSKLAPAYRRLLHDMGPKLSADLKGIETLRQQLLKAILPLAPFDGFRPVPGTMFDPAAPAPTVFEEFRAAAQPVLDHHNDVLAQLRTLNTPDAVQLRQLGAWIARADLKALAVTAPPDVQADIAYFVSLDAVAQKNVLIGERENQTPAPLTYLEEATGFAISQDPPPVTDPCPQGQLNDRCERLEKTRERLERLLAFLESAAAVADLKTAVNRTSSYLGEQKISLLQLQDAANKREASVVEHLALISGRIPESFTTMATTMGNLETRKTWYLSNDTGIAVAPWINEVFPYTGVNIYFRPVNKEAPPASAGTRLSALVGFTWTNNLVEPGEREALFANDAMLLVGAGLRLTDVVKLNGGALIMKSPDPNPLVSNTKLKMTPFFALSADIDIAGIMSHLFGGQNVPPVIGSGAQPAKK